MKQPANNAVGSYFDTIAADYAKRYDTSRPYHHYLFHERLKIATQTIGFQGNSIFDIGAGTGGLYDLIAAKTNHFDYFATDISPEMLAQSNIPPSNYSVGTWAEVSIPKQTFDYIFILGVSTYLTPDELDKTLQIAAKMLAQNGQLIVSYTNPRSLDWSVRKRIRTIWRGRGVIGQNFETYAHDPHKIRLANTLQTARTVWYNATLTPFNTLFPRPSIWLAKRIDKWPTNRWKPILCGDIVCTYVKKDCP